MKKFLLAFFFSIVSLCAFAQKTDYYLENIKTVDTYIRNSLPNNSFGYEQNLITGGWGDIYITMIKFDISKLPIITTGDKVSLWLYNKSPGGNSKPTSVNIGLLASDFNNNTTWNHDFSYYDYPANLYRQVNVNTYGYWTEFDITDYYNYWKGNVPNYGLFIVPLNYNGNQFNFFQSSSTNTPSNQKPLIRITKASSKIELKWPLSTSYNSRVVTHGFGEDWAGKSYCPKNVIKKHSGVDYRAKAGDPVYAAYDGYVKLVFTDSSWGSVIVIEHTKPDNTKFTTNYWHVNSYTATNNYVSKGDLIGNIYDLNTNTHFHFGIRDNHYNEYTHSNNKVSIFSSVGALPQQNCVDAESQKYYPAFPEKFLNPENNNKFYIQ